MTKYKKKEEIAPHRLEVKAISLKWKHRFDENRTRIRKYLFSINVCSSMVLELWHSQFKNVQFIDAKKLVAKGQAYDLSEFMVKYFLRTKIYGKSYKLKINPRIKCYFQIEKL